MPLISFDTPWKHQKTRGFMMFSGGIKRDQWHEMGEVNVLQADKHESLLKGDTIIFDGVG